MAKPRQQRLVLASPLLYYLKSEKISAPNHIQMEVGASINPTYHGINGPVHVGFFNLRKREHDLTSAMNRTLGDMGVPWNSAVNSGRMRGYTIHPSTVDEGACSE